MLYRLLGRTGLKVSVFSLGSWITFDKKLQQSEVNTCMQYAFDQGINLFDTAEVYGEGRVETIMGNALTQLQLPRDEYTICTKVFWGGPAPTQMGLHRKHIIEGCHQSLKRLQLDYVDFYLCHRPDPNTAMEEIVMAMNILIQQGKILYWGTSEWTGQLILEAYYIAKQMNLIPPNIEQFEYNLLNREMGEKIIPDLNVKMGIGSMVTMPLARGVLAGRYNENVSSQSRINLPSHANFRAALQSEVGKQRLLKVKKMSAISAQLGLSQAQLSLVWCLHNQDIHTVILGVSRLEQLQENIKALEFLEKGGLDEASSAMLEAVFDNKPAPHYEASYAEVIAES